jgi:glutathione peroxidase
MEGGMQARVLATVVALCLATPALAGFSFPSIDGGTIALDDWAGKPVLVVNTASLCGFAGQFDDLQALHDRYGARGLLVLAVPSNDFRQELASEAEVKDYCAMRFDLTLPMATITQVRGPEAHPFYLWMKSDHGFEPVWNFNKVLLGPQGEVAGTWGAGTNPSGPQITGAIEALLP